MSLISIEAAAFARQLPAGGSPWAGPYQKLRLASPDRQSNHSPELINCSAGFWDLRNWLPSVWHIVRLPLGMLYSRPSRSTEVCEVSLVNWLSQMESGGVASKLRVQVVRNRLERSRLQMAIRVTELPEYFCCRLSKRSAESTLCRSAERTLCGCHSRPLPGRALHAGYPDRKGWYCCCWSRCS